MRSAEDDVENRRPVWEALSDMFLDTDVSLFREARVEKLAASPYSIGELESILVNEVYPVCAGNLLSIAGEWAGFDEGWLQERILRRSRSRGIFHFLNPGRLTVPLSFEWRATKAGIAAARRLPDNH
ncbi:DUF7079 family protein [Massilia endophytica]|uniref:DUF7079 family protein n=1 Tax=Massilia endophytica TaxID=2899220 RepID=UPI001E65B620|nr:hypothetical protein [Massilia endophytica]UGQ48711.1 hypothetical protein LSQ66_09695 [Massilia endophytica]